MSRVPDVYAGSIASLYACGSAANGARFVHLCRLVSVVHFDVTWRGWVWHDVNEQTVSSCVSLVRVT